MPSILLIVRHIKNSVSDQQLSKPNATKRSFIRRISIKLHQDFLIFASHVSMTSVEAVARRKVLHQTWGAYRGEDNLGSLEKRELSDPAVQQ